MARRASRGGKVDGGLRAARPAAGATSKAGSATRRPPSTLRWPVWASLVLTVVYVLLHLQVLSAAMTLSGGLMSALLLGE